MKVDNKVFYHVCTKKEGEIYLDSKSTHLFNSDFKNFRYLDILNYNPQIPSKNFGLIGWLKYLDKIHESFENLNFDDKSWKEFISEVCFQSYKLNSRYWEFIFEEVRIDNYSVLPSRFNCIYLCDDDLKYWYDKGLTELNVQELPIYELIVSGEIHHGDSQWLELDVLPNVDIISQAENYWKGNITKQGKLDEFLFWGEISINKKFKSLEEIT